MQRTIQYHIWPNDVDFGKKIKLLLNFVKKSNFEIKQNAQDPANLFIIKKDRYTTDETGFIEDFIELLNNTPSLINFTFILHFIRNDNDKDFLIIGLGYSKECIEVHVLTEDDADMVYLTHNFIKENFHLKNPEIPLTDDNRSLYLNPTVFIGRRFNKVADDYYNKLSSFFELLGFDVIQGEEYNSNYIPEKVKNRIDTQDIFIALISGDKHDWITSESSYAHKGGKHIILLVENNTVFNPTLLGKDLEQYVFLGMY